ncbi:Crp/Fnr family transcriptional regulator [Ideonella livida]|uniref:Crp/Fnr family transcriptional regulator n=1 Tax=Ideonella livida TaxID=2707176 RepID=A0A7C9PEQ8_9BURK|nr:Crp/Fnr family transcriptional regulator [Ideonella livida]NDY90037.1 Crp/Fnr family transcriptional regulator [Ideonella livida]
MDPMTACPSDTVLPPDRAPLTRLRASSRALAGNGLADLPAGPRHLLPDVGGWAAALGGANLAAQDAAALNEVARGRRLPAGALVFCQGELARGPVLVLEGDVAVGHRQEEGGFRTERHVHGPGWLDLCNGLLGTCYTADARAMTPSTVIELPCEPLMALLDEQSLVSRQLLLTLAGESRAMALNTHDLMHRDAPGRLAAWLLGRCGQASVVQLPMRKRDIASQLAITPETLSRLMRSFSGQGMIRVEGYTVHVLDATALTRLAQA